MRTREILKWKVRNESTYRKAAALGILATDRDAVTIGALGVGMLLLSLLFISAKQYQIASIFVVVSIFSLQLAIGHFSNMQTNAILQRIDEKLDILVKKVQNHRNKHEKR